MILSINTTHNDAVEIILKRRDGLILAKKKFKARFKQAEKLLPAIEKLLKINKLKLSSFKKITVENRAGSFTSLRIGVVTANALGYALNLPVSDSGGKAKIVKTGQRNFKVVEPIYSKEPEITAKKDRAYRVCG